MKKLFFICLLAAHQAYSDTMEHYMNIVNNIPKMEMNADPQAQAWARSARNVLAITTESIAETLLEANANAKNQGQPLFCLPNGTQLNTMTLDGIIQQTYKEISSQQSDKQKMSVSQVAWMGVRKNFPCNQNQAQNNNQTANLQALLTH